MPPEPLDTEGHVWRWLDQVVDLNAAEGTYAPNVRAAILAHRDASTPEEVDTAVYVMWSTEEHPPTENSAQPGCRTCRTDEPCPEQDRAHSLATQFLTAKAWQLVQRSRQRMAEFDRARREGVVAP